MTIPKQFVNLIGAVVIVAILALGVTLVAVPFYSNSQTIDTKRREVSQTNDIFAIQVAQLSSANERIDEIDAEVATLRTQIPPTLKMDDVVELVLVAAAENGASIEGLTVDEVEAFAARPGAAAEDASARATADDPTVPAEEEQTATDETATDAEGDGTADGTTGDGAAAEAPAETPAAEDSPQRQIPVTIEVKVDSAARAAAFMDALGRGPRLIVPTSGKYDAGTLIITAYALMRTGE